MSRLLCVLALVAGLVAAQHTTVLAQPAANATVKAVLFYSPTCPHCHTVINDTLIPLMDQYGDRLLVIGIDITQPGGQALYDASSTRFQIPQDRMGVPRLIVGETVLIGSLEIPEQFPGIIETGLSNGGIDWPAIPGLAEAMAASHEAEQAQATAAEAMATEAPTTASATPLPAATPTAAIVAASVDTLPAAGTGAAGGLPEGGGLAAIILGGMLLALAYAGFRIYSARATLFSSGGAWGAAITSPLILVLALLGLAVAGYLAYVEITHTAAVCGPVGECNVVQSSDYAQVIGIPVAVLGIVNYLAIMGLWVIQRPADGKWRRWTAWALLLMTVFGVLFSIYLTLLELFVIDAVCMWCLSSAVITTSLLLVVVWQLTRRPPVDARRQQQSALQA